MAPAAGGRGVSHRNGLTPDARPADSENSAKVSRESRASNTSLNACSPCPGRLSSGRPHGLSGSDGLGGPFGGSLAVSAAGDAG
jgi:hypothetical protein